MYIITYVSKYAKYHLCYLLLAFWKTVGKFTKYLYTIVELSIS